MSTLHFSCNCGAIEGPRVRVRVRVRVRGRVRVKVRVRVRVRVRVSFTCVYRRFRSKKLYERVAMEGCKRRLLGLRRSRNPNCRCGDPE